MNRNLSLIVASVILFTLLGVWIYLAFFANQDTETTTEPDIEVEGEFGNLSELGDDAPEAGISFVGVNVGGQDTDEEVEEEEVYDPDILRQLTTKNVVGFVELEIASTTHIMFMESGVGHIHTIDLSTGIEERVSGTTIPGAKEAAFSSDGSFFVVKTGEHTGVNPLSIGTLDTINRTATVSPFIAGANDFLVTDTDEILYTTLANNSTIINAYDPATDINTVVHRTPFREATVLLNKTLNGPHYFYPKIAVSLEGFLYELLDGTLTRLPVDGFNFAAATVADQVIFTHRQGRTIFTELYNGTPDITELVASDVPQKCVGVETAVFCARPEQTIHYDSIVNWLKGSNQFSDDLWLIGDDEDKLIDITNHSGRQVDVLNPMIGPVSTDWYFQNKIDGTLWIYELSRSIDTILGTDDGSIIDE